MKLQYKLAIIGTVVLFVWFVVPFPWSFDQTTETFSCASISLKKLSEFDISRTQYTPVLISSEQLAQSRIIYDLVIQAEKTIPPKNDRGYTELSLDEVISIHKLVRDEIAKQKGNPEDYTSSIPKVHQTILDQQNMTGYLYSPTIAPKIFHEGNAYSINGVFSFPPQAIEHVNVQLAKHDYSNSMLIEMDDARLSQYPKIQDAISQIGTRDDSVRISRGVSEDSWDDAREWFGKHQTEQNVTRGSHFEYNDNIYSIGFAIC